MTKEEKVQYWTDLSDRELATAELLVKGKQYLWAGFMCHQVIEKIFKAYYSALTDEKKYDARNNLLAYLYLTNKTFLKAHLLKEVLAEVDDSIDFKYKHNIK